MKKPLFTLLFIITACISFAQTSADPSEHLSFKGVPINGTLAEYVAKMKSNGFTLRTTKDGAALLEGEFASYRNCTVVVATLKQKDLVCKIGVLFPNQDDWSSLSSDYFTLKELLTEKYGDPSESVEKFQSHTPDSDGSKMLEVKLDACKYYTIYETAKGSIQLSIEHDNLMGCFVKLVYFDKINGGKAKKQALDDL